MSGLTILKNLSRYKQTAIIDSEGEYSYPDLLDASHRVASYLLKDREDLDEAGVSFFVPPGFEYVAVMLGIWRAGGIAVPLSVSHPDPELEYVVKDSGAELLLAAPQFNDRLGKLAEKTGTDFSTVEEAVQCKKISLPLVSEDRRAMIIYTSGTTSTPKGVVSTHASIRAQIASLVKAWEWTSGDFILNVLPLHHLHGIINALFCALWSGASCELMPGFDAGRVWGKFTDGSYTLFMAVPTIYSRLIRVWQNAPPEKREEMSGACGRMRLMVSGSAALPVSTLEKWKEISGHVLLERYGMTETGMALSNPLHGERMPGHVCKPLPGVEVKLIDENETVIRGAGEGEIIIKGPNVFFEYWRKPDATKEAFINGEWFRTGDIARRNKDGVYRIMGRSSVDIIKSGGYKVSALEVEEVLREHPQIEECAVVGVEDEEWGERVCAALVLGGKKKINLASLRKWSKERMASYKVPSAILFVDELPHNQMGKVVKPEVAALFNSQ
ncbi:MAG: acyl-CoA synthetase [Deltaproteobacteria bacterium]